LINNLSLNFGKLSTLSICCIKWMTSEDENPEYSSHEIVSEQLPLLLASIFPISSSAPPFLRFSVSPLLRSFAPRHASRRWVTGLTVRSSQSRRAGFPWCWCWCWCRRQASHRDWRPGSCTRHSRLSFWCSGTAIHTNSNQVKYTAASESLRVPWPASPSRWASLNCWV
jgi:hypothetical protein